MEIKISSFSQEAASKTKGLELRRIMEDNIDKVEEMTIDFRDIKRFASPFFNNSFAALALKYGFEKIKQIKLVNISTVGIETYKTSMDNAEMLLSNLSEMVPWADEYRQYESKHQNDNRQLCQNLFKEPDKPTTPLKRHNIHSNISKTA